MRIKTTMEVVAGLDILEKEFSTMKCLVTTPYIPISPTKEGFGFVNAVDTTGNLSDIYEDEGKIYKIPDKGNVTIATCVTKKMPIDALQKVRKVLGIISGTVRTEACAYVFYKDGVFDVGTPRYQVLTPAHYAVSAEAHNHMIATWKGWHMIAEFHSHPFGLGSGAFFSGEDHHYVETRRGRIYGNMTFGKDEAGFGKMLMRLPGVKEFIDPSVLVEGDIPAITDAAADVELSEQTLADIDYVIQEHSDNASMFSGKRDIKKTVVDTIHSLLSAQLSWLHPKWRPGHIGADVEKKRAGTTVRAGEIYLTDRVAIDTKFRFKSINAAELIQQISDDMGLVSFGSLAAEKMKTRNALLKHNGLELLVVTYTADEEFEYKLPDLKAVRPVADAMLLLSLSLGQAILVVATGGKIYRVDTDDGVDGRLGTKQPKVLTRYEEGLLTGTIPKSEVSYGSSKYLSY